MKILLQAGVDEAGRGCLAGPVVAAAVLWSEEYRVVGLTDSKVLSHRQRENLREQLEALLPAGHWAVGSASPAEIDEVNRIGLRLLSDSAKAPSASLAVGRSKSSGLQHLITSSLSHCLMGLPRSNLGRSPLTTRVTMVGSLELPHGGSR